MYYIIEAGTGVHFKINTIIIIFIIITLLMCIDNDY